MNATKRMKPKSAPAKLGGVTSPFAGNGLSRTAMVYRIATIAGHTLSVVEMKKIKNVNARSLESAYNEVLRLGNPDDALFALKLILG